MLKFCVELHHGIQAALPLQSHSGTAKWKHGHGSAGVGEAPALGTEMQNWVHKMGNLTGNVTNT